MMIKKLLTNLRDSLFNNGAETYEIIRIITNVILEDHYEEIGKRIAFPIDIWGLVRSYGIEIIETNLNADMGFRISRQSGTLRYLKDGSAQIYLEDSDSDNTKRYMLAHEFSHFLLNDSDKKNACCGDPLMPKRWDEQIADVMAACFLFPYRLVLEEMLSYKDWMKDHNRYPINATEWLQKLAETAHVSSYHTIICYQYIKSCICYLYNTNDDSDGSKFVKDIRFEELFR